MEFTKQYSAYTILGFGIIVFHDLDLASRFEKIGHKIHRKFGKTFGVSIMYFAK